MSELVNLGLSYLSDIENGKKPAPNDKSVLRLADILNLSEDERIIFFDIAALSKKQDKNNFHIPVDISECIYYSESLKSQIRNRKNKL